MTDGTFSEMLSQFSDEERARAQQEQEDKERARALGSEIVELLQTNGVPTNGTGWELRRETLVRGDFGQDSTYEYITLDTTGTVYRGNKYLEGAYALQELTSRTTLAFVHSAIEAAKRRK